MSVESETDKRDVEARGQSQHVTRSAPSSSPGETDSARAKPSALQERPTGDGQIVSLHAPQTGHPDAERESAPGPKQNFLRRRLFGLTTGLVIAALIASTGYVYWDHAQRFETTDDAFIAARAFPITPKVSGYITDVPVTDNQHVASGEVIARIDDRDYRAALNQAKALLNHDRTVLEQAEKNLGRYQTLAKTNSIAQQQVDDQAFLVEQDKSTVALDQAKVDAAELDLAHATISAAEAGRVVNLSAAVGQFVQAGTSLAIFVPDKIWITANFKETQLNAMRAGQQVTFAIDAYPGRTIQGRVASIQPGSGTAFSLLPPQNATGNYVKIVQRVPVKIIIDDPATDIVLGPGMSVVPTVRTDPAQSLYERLKALL